MYISVCVKACPAKEAAYDCNYADPARNCPKLTLYGTEPVEGYCMPNGAFREKMYDLIKGEMEKSEAFGTFAKYATDI